MKRLTGRVELAEQASVEDVIRTLIEFKHALNTVIRSWMDHCDPKMTTIVASYRNANVQPLSEADTRKQKRFCVNSGEVTAAVRSVVGDFLPLIGGGVEGAVTGVLVIQDAIRDLITTLNAAHPELGNTIVEFWETEAGQKLAKVETAKAERWELATDNFLEQVEVTSDVYYLMEALSHVAFDAMRDESVTEQDPSEVVIKMTREVAQKAAEDHENPLDWELRVITSIQSRMDAKAAVS